MTITLLKYIETSYSSSSRFKQLLSTVYVNKRNKYTGMYHLIIIQTRRVLICKYSRFFLLMFEGYRIRCALDLVRLDS